MGVREPSRDRWSTSGGHGREAGDVLFQGGFMVRFARSIPILVCVLLVPVTAMPALAEVLPPGLKIEKVLDSSATLGDLAQSPTGELWLLEQAGTIRVLENGLEVASLTIPVATAGDGGLLDVAFDPDHRENGRALVSYVDVGGHLRVDEVFQDGSGLTLGATILDVGATASGSRPGGGLVIGRDGMLYVGVGDLGTSGDAQDDASLAGKVLRAELDGSIPPDNPSGTLVWAKGFRFANDLAVNRTTTRPEGTVYVSDLGQSGSVYDEIDTVTAGGNYGWSQHSGPGGGFAEPLVAHSPTVGVAAVAALAGTSLGEDAEGSVLYACEVADDVERIVLTGPDRDQVVSSGPFFDPDGDRDGTPDAGCPSGIHALEHAGDGQLYAAANGDNPGVWRVWRDTPGPREVSAAGSPFPLTVSKIGADLALAWEDLGSIDTGRPTRNGGQHATVYSVWEGTLPIGGGYDHARVLDTDGLPEGTARRTATISTGSGSRYYLVGAQGDNTEGPLGAGRPAVEDWCDTVGWGIRVGNCAARWVDPTDPGQELRLVDKNPNSPTFNEYLTMSDFRGRVVRMDISSDNCVWCNVQSSFIPPLDAELRDRDLTIVTVFTETYGGVKAYATEAACATAAAAWAGANDDAPILCDVDRNGDGHGDVSWQYWHDASDCGGTPQNFYIDQGNVMYKFVCGAELSTATMRNTVINEVNPESCE